MTTATAPAAVPPIIAPSLFALWVEVLVSEGAAEPWSWFESDATVLEPELEVCEPIAPKIVVVVVLPEPDVTEPDCTGPCGEFDDDPVFVLEDVEVDEEVDEDEEVLEVVTVSSAL